MKKLFKQLKCYCNKPLKILRKPYQEDYIILECEDYHCSIMLDSNGKHIIQYEYCSKVGINHIRYEIIADEFGKCISIYSKKNSDEYTLLATLGYLPPKIEDDRIQIQPLIKKLKLINVLS